MSCCGRIINNVVMESNSNIHCGNGKIHLQWVPSHLGVMGNTVRVTTHKIDRSQE